ncbi:FBP domain-containing protein [Frondihabitans sp. Leaf304]|uniref:FBP domain-containing protein n=1 Tax=Frondihabitans sp. Leaf304 TaxID=1736329 RepID=UPI0006FC8BB4|nr:FBP domain-containing protein [Frondihabitans sp. Leaf304]KQQ25623.1 translation elongation factor [Frondihabitans sp. Leaf304]
MLPLTEKTIRSSFSNASRKEVSDLTLPPSFGEIEWDALDFLGWRDPKMPRRAYAVIPSVGDGVTAIPSGGGGVTAILLRQGDVAPTARAQCAWCQDVTLPSPVVFYSAKRSGALGRNGNTLGTLVCADFECSTNARRRPPQAYLGFDADAARDEQVVRLRSRVAAFAASV